MSKTAKIVTVVIVVAVIAYFGWKAYQKNKASKPLTVVPGAPAEKAA
jgi:predicted negative regulator of RcsB-dependent stress response